MMVVLAVLGALVLAVVAKRRRRRRGVVVVPDYEVLGGRDPLTGKLDRMGF